MTRYIRGLTYAHECKRPSSIPVGRPRGAKARGLAYERALHVNVGGIRGQWFEYEDANGRGYCQTDVLIGHEGMAVVMECKYTWTLDGHLALAKLYLPVVAMALKRPVCGLVVCKKLIPDVALHGIQVCSSLDDALTAAPRRCVAWHWNGTPGLAPHAGIRPQHVVDTHHTAL